MKAVVIILGLAIAAVAVLAEEEDPVIAKLDDGGPRFQYMPGPNGLQLVDLWLRLSDVLQIARYNPENSNRYVLFTRSNPSGEEIPSGSDVALYSSTYDVTKKTVVLTHGWLNTPSSDFNVQLISAYLDAEDVNVIMVDWSEGAAPNYLIAMNNVIKSADHVGKFVKWLLDITGGDINNYHIIGHSLGAHLAGIVGRYLDGKVPYLTGLDPALPGWITHKQSISKDVALYT
ncbi:unnamed protein product [Arctia plantaginis]|uniref:Lipase domain-containing protein n=1 Tax=Arctia plantaginis TaxID=874455 RepID=A0A8S1BHP9_ARCPL|nr:unnamed protein product [Arctia plantaginis]